MLRRHFMPAVGGLGMSSAALSQSPSTEALPPEAAARQEDFWFQVRHAFTVERNALNFNNGSLCPAPKIVQEAMDRHWSVTNMSPSLYVDEILLPQSEIVRQELAREFGCDAEELALTRNTSEGLHNVIFGLPLKAGDEVLTTTQDYPSMLNALRQRSRRDGIVLKQFSYPTPPSDPGVLTDLFLKNIRPQTRALLISHLSFTTGQIFPVAEICQEARRRGIFTIIDGAHGFAHLPFTVKDLGCDFYATSLHKWLFAPVGTGFLYVRKERIPDLWPLMGAPETLSNNVRKFESVGTQPVAMRTAIGEALAFHRSIGTARKHARLCYLRERWEQRLRGRKRITIRSSADRRLSAGIGALSIEGLPAPQLVELLEKKHLIHTRARVVPNEFECIRITPNLYSTLDEIDRFSAAIESLSA